MQTDPAPSQQKEVPSIPSTSGHPDAGDHPPTAGVQGAPIVDDTTQANAMDSLADHGGDCPNAPGSADHSTSKTPPAQSMSQEGEPGGPSASPNQSSGPRIGVSFHPAVTIIKDQDMRRKIDAILQRFDHGYLDSDKFTEAQTAVHGFMEWRNHPDTLSPPTEETFSFGVIQATGSFSNWMKEIFKFSK